MAYKLIITDRADADLDGIIDYIAFELSNPPAATALLDRVSACYDRLEENPHLYALTPHPVFQTLGIRRAPVGGYNVFFRIADGEVHIVRILSDLEAIEGKL